MYLSKHFAFEIVITYLIQTCILYQTSLLGDFSAQKKLYFNYMCLTFPLIKKVSFHSNKSFLNPLINTGVLCNINEKTMNSLVCLTALFVALRCW